MGEDYLARGFADVDAAGGSRPYTDCLSLLDGLPYYREVKSRSYELLALGPGMRVLDCGCGLGDDCLRMAPQVSPGGRIIGMDESRAMVERAQARAPGPDAPLFLRAAAPALPFAGASFHRARIDRCLQHMQDPQAVIAELCRVLAPGGILLAYDNDWGSFCISSENRGLTRRLTDFWCDSFQSGWAGRFLSAWFSDAGLCDIGVFPSTSLITDWDLADRVYNLAETAKRAAEQGLATGEEADAWVEELKKRSRQGRFFSSLTACTVIGTKP